MRGSPSTPGVPLRRLTSAGSRPARRALAHVARLALPVALALAACAPAGPRPIRYDAEACGYCRMTISDRRFGAEAASRTGKVQAFDSIECLADYVDGADAAAVRAAWVTDFTHPGTFIPVEGARFVRLTRTGSPMGRGLAALPTADATPATLARLGAEGAPMDWAALLADARARRATAAGAAHAH